MVPCGPARFDCPSRRLITIVLRISQPGGLRLVIAESVLIKHQLLIVNRSRRRAPNLRVGDRLIAGFCSLWIKPKRLLRSAIAFKPATLLNFHRALVQRKYRMLFSPNRRVKPGPKGWPLEYILIGMWSDGFLPVDSSVRRRHSHCPMLKSLLLAIRFLILVFSGHKQVAFENVALRHQLAVFTRE